MKPAASRSRGVVVVFDESSNREGVYYVGLQDCNQQTGQMLNCFSIQTDHKPPLSLFYKSTSAGAVELPVLQSHALVGASNVECIKVHMALPAFSLPAEQAPSAAV